jgi:hypothetical protein
LISQELKRPGSSRVRRTRLQVGDPTLKLVTIADPASLDPFLVGQALLAEGIAKGPPRRRIAPGGDTDLRAEAAAGAPASRAMDGFASMRRPTHRLATLEADPGCVTHPSHPQGAAKWDVDVRYARMRF